MPQVDPIQGFTGLPAYPETYQVPDSLAALYSFLLNRAIPRFTSATERDAAIPSPVDGQMAVTDNGTNTRVWIAANGWRLLWMDTGWVTTGFTVQSGATSIGNARIRRVADAVYVYISNIVPNSISVPVSGDVTNTPVVQVPAGFEPAFTQGLHGAGTGPLAQFEIISTGIIRLASVLPPVTSTASSTLTSQISVAGVYHMGS